MIMSSTTTVTTAPSSTTSSSPQSAGGAVAVVEVNRLHRVELLRAELDRSLKLAAAAASLNSVAAKRSPLCIVFRAADAVHIQFSGSARASVDLFAAANSRQAGRCGSGGATAAASSTTAALSRFTVSPTPNAVPAALSPSSLTASSKCGSGVIGNNKTAMAWPLHVLTSTTTNNSRSTLCGAGDDDGGGDSKYAIAAAELLRNVGVAGRGSDTSHHLPPAESQGDNKQDYSVTNIVEQPSLLPASNQAEDGAAIPLPAAPPIDAGAANTAAAVVAASSPASSVDSGVASPGAAGDDFLLLNASSAVEPFGRSLMKEEVEQMQQQNNAGEQYNNNNAKLYNRDRALFNNSPCWATVPRTRRWIFNFSNNGSGNNNTDFSQNAANNNNGSPLIDALALSSSASSVTAAVASTAEASKPELLLFSTAPPSSPTLTLQKPPLKKKYGPTTITSGEQLSQQQESVVVSASPTQFPSSCYCSPSVQMVAASTEPVVIINGERAENVAPHHRPSVVQPVQRQLSDSVCCYGGRGGDGADSDTALETEDIACGLPPRAGTVPPLRSILKKTRSASSSMMASVAPTRQQHVLDTALPRNQLRRLPTRTVLERSVSESLLDNHGLPDDQFSALQHSAAAAFNVSVLNKLSMASAPLPPVFVGSFAEQKLEEEQEQQRQQKLQMNNGCGGSADNTSPSSASSSSCPSSCSSETIDTDGSVQVSAAPITKKRVSFSDCVKARYFRSNSSILGQRRKNEKKSARKRTSSRRCSADGGVQQHASSTDEEMMPQQPPQQCHNNDNGSETNPATDRYHCQHRSITYLFN